MDTTMTKEEFKKKLIERFIKQVSKFLDEAEHIGNITKITGLDDNSCYQNITFKYENPIMDNVENSGIIKIEMYN